MEYENFVINLSLSCFSMNDSTIKREKTSLKKRFIFDQITKFECMNFSHNFVIHSNFVIKFYQYSIFSENHRKE